MYTFEWNWFLQCLKNYHRFAFKLDCFLFKSLQIINVFGQGVFKQRVQLNDTHTLCYA